jgi:hypothetical protein
VPSGSVRVDFGGTLLCDQQLENGRADCAVPLSTAVVGHGAACLAAGGCPLDVGYSGDARDAPEAFAVEIRAGPANTLVATVQPG